MTNQRAGQELQQSPKIELRFFYGYVIVAISFLIMLLSGSLYTFGIFFKPLLKEFGWSRAAISGAFSLQAILFGFSSVVAGRLNDRFGARVIASGSGMFLGLGYLLMSQVSAIWHIYLFYGVLVAMGMGCAVVPLMSTVARWFVKRRGLMTGITIAGGGIGVMIMPPVATWLIANYGWRTSYSAIGIMLLVVILFFAQFLKSDPGQLGLLPYGQKEFEEEGSHSEVGGFSLRGATCTRQFWLLCIAYAGLGMFLFSIMVHIVPHAIELGFSATMAASILSTIGGLSIAGRILIGGISDRIGNRLAAMIGFILTTAALAWLLIAKDMPMLYWFAAVFGFAYGGLSALQSPLVADLFRLRSHGAILGVIFFGGTIGGAIGPVLAGYIFDVTTSYRMAFLVCTVTSAVGIISAALGTTGSTRR